MALVELLSGGALVGSLAFYWSERLFRIGDFPLGLARNRSLHCFIRYAASYAGGGGVEVFHTNRLQWMHMLCVDKI